MLSFELAQSNCKERKASKKIQNEKRLPVLSNVVRQLFQASLVGKEYDYK